MEPYFCDSIRRMIIGLWNVTLLDLHVKHHGLINVLNFGNSVILNSNSSLTVTVQLLAVIKLQILYIE